MDANLISFYGAMLILEAVMLMVHAIQCKIEKRKTLHQRIVVICIALLMFAVGIFFITSIR